MITFYNEVTTLVDKGGGGTFLYTILLDGLNENSTVFLSKGYLENWCTISWYTGVSHFRVQKRINKDWHLPKTQCITIFQCELKTFYE